MINIIDHTDEWISAEINIPSTQRTVAVRWDSDRRVLHGKQPINDDFGYYDRAQGWWVTENNERPNNSYPHFWKDV